MPLSLGHLLQGAVRHHPSRAAVTIPGGAALSYAELDRASARVRSSLIARGVRRGDRVGLLLPKSLQSVIGVWGVLRAGAAYVPIDAGSPPARAALIAADCGLHAVLASTTCSDLIAGMRERVPAMDVLLIHGSEIVGDNGFDLPPMGLRREGEPDVVVNTRDLAYVLYTSGSTGVPKGVMISHGAALSFVEWAVNRIGLHSADVLSNHAPLHFDLSTFDLFGAAMAGARLVVLDEETVRFPMAAAEVLEHEHISVWYSVPGALRAMLRRGRLAARNLSALRTVLFAGEVYPPDELAALQAALPHVAFFNLYGPSETNVCTYWAVPPAGKWTTLSIGIDCENCQGVVVDESLQRVPDGKVGELLVRGGTLMDGYWGDPERTAKAFVHNILYPHRPDPFYRTGDLVSRQSDGSYLFHGRRDQMVKVRGYRVELGEVEVALNAILGVAEAAVSVRQRNGDSELVAFVAGDDRNADVDARYVHDRLTFRLPKYMLPAEIKIVRQLPKTSNGKIDRQALARRLQETAEGAGLKES